MLIGGQAEVSRGRISARSEAQGFRTPYPTSPRTLITDPAPDPPSTLLLPLLLRLFQSFIDAEKLTPTPIPPLTRLSAPILTPSFTYTPRPSTLASVIYGSREANAQETGDARRDGPPRQTGQIHSPTLFTHRHSPTSNTFTHPVVSLISSHVLTPP